MQKLIELKQRMKTVQNIQSITRTLATVSSAKLSRTRHRAAGMRYYTKKMRETLYHQQEYLERRGLELESFSAFFSSRAGAKKIALLHLTSDKGMCGNYNITANRMSLEFIQAQEAEGKEVVLITKGQKGERYFRKKTDNPIIHAEAWKRAGISLDDVQRIYNLITDLFLSGQVDEVHCLYTQFYSPIRRFTRIIKMLPVKPGIGKRKMGKVENDEFDKWFYEPSFESVLDELVSIFLKLQVEDVLLESYASEHGARMITMEEATERADKTLKQHVALFNRLRREVITIDLLGVLFASQVREEEKSKAG